MFGIANDIEGNMSGRYSKRVYSTLICNECGLRMTIPRRNSRKRKEGHIKTMYCPKCDRSTDFTENNTRTLEERGEEE